MPSTFVNRVSPEPSTLTTQTSCDAPFLSSLTSWMSRSNQSNIPIIRPYVEYTLSRVVGPARYKYQDLNKCGAPSITPLDRRALEIQPDRYWTLLVFLDLGNSRLKVQLRLQPPPLRRDSNLFFCHKLVLVRTPVRAAVSAI
jgi:hypothetical protein